MQIGYICLWLNQFKLPGTSVINLYFAMHVDLPDANKDYMLDYLTIKLSSMFNCLLKILSSLAYMAVLVYEIFFNVNRLFACCQQNRICVCMSAKAVYIPNPKSDKEVF